MSALTRPVDAAVAAPQAAAPARPSPLTLLVLLAGVFITTLDFFIVNVAIPDTQASLHASGASVQWVVAGFGLALGSCLIVSGRLGDLFGRRAMYLTGLGLFLLASLACGLAPNIGVLLAARAIQGVGAAITMPQALGIMNVVFTGRARARAFAGYGLAMGIAGVFGQLIGGALIAADIAGSGWRGIYLINVPFCLVTLALAARVLPESRAAHRTRLDILGALLAAAAIVAVVLPLVQGQQDGWPLWTWLSFAGAVVLGVGTVRRQRRVGRVGGAPLVDPRLFQDRTFAAGSAVAFVYMLAMASFFLVLALYLQDGRGLTPLDSGVVFAALGVGYVGASSRASGLAARLGRQAVALGALVQGVGYVATALVVHHIGAGGSTGWLVAPLFVIGAGMGLALAPIPAIALAGVDPRHAAAGSGVLSTAQQVGGAVGVALIGIVFYPRLDGTAHGVAAAFTASLVLLAACCAATALLTQALPRRRG